MLQGVAAAPELILTPVDDSPRVLILTADIGAGHDLPGRAARRRAARPPAATEVTVVDGLAAMGPIVLAVIRSGSETILAATAAAVRRPVLADRALGADAPADARAVARSWAAPALLRLDRARARPT